LEREMAAALVSGDRPGFTARDFALVAVILLPEHVR
jgi:hypothetical protein